MATRQCSSVSYRKYFKYFTSINWWISRFSGSNNTKTNNSKVINSKNFDGNYIHYGVREHGMAAVMNGLALYSGLIPYGGTF